MKEYILLAIKCVVAVNSAEGEYRIFGRLGEFILIIGNLYKGHRLFCCKILMVKRW